MSNLDAKEIRLDRPRVPEVISLPPIAETRTLLELLKNESLTTTYVERLEGSVAIAQGPGAVAAGERGASIRGNVHGSLIITGDENAVQL